MNEYVFPKKVIASNGATCENLFVKQDLQISLDEPKITVFSQNDYVILDFGAELCGGVRILAFKA